MVGERLGWCSIDDLVLSVTLPGTDFPAPQRFNPGLESVGLYEVLVQIEVEP